ncbi:phospholipid-transporting ATPase 1 [Dendrobium catenatum]|uniref:Phospholipid-transporting ATPase n=1 Tax=Dendrobium catenatum TaxID=906689 RepID=A0A2I0XHQ6_9ASPA|nr:phospholipid-transporting ATPase 1 [Dendrobium catenatum]PKU87430.1 Phospholipid-transporting ATPase 1 [Dendrobium catenatum]
MASDRPLLIPSPRTPVPSDDPAPITFPPLAATRSSSSSSRRKSAAPHSRNLSVENVGFSAEMRSSSKTSFSIETISRSVSKQQQPPPMPRYGSRRSESGHMSSSQKEISDADARLVYINDPDRSNSPVRHPNNSIRTTKYSVLTFLPKNLFEQFHRVAYIYFLILAAINQIPQLGVFTPAASILPLAFVLGVTAVKDAYEDYRRHRSDRTENSRSASVLSSSSDFQPKPWKDIRVGEIIRVHSNETIPCDLVLLATSDPTGVAYVQTINLDGESNLKTRYAKQETLSKPLETLTAIIRCEKPNRNIYGFHGNVEIDGSKQRVSLGPSNIILRGCELKNTTWVDGVAVYTGKDTKVMLNSSGAQSKRSRLETHMNRETIILAVALFVECTIVTVLAGAWLGRHRDQLDDLTYYRKTDFSDREVGKYNYYGIGWEVVFTFFMSVILFQVMIPIALYISMELVRLGQAFFMIQDESLFDKERGNRFQCRALNINEDLGQIKYVFSDKTGTLTENKMEFRCASVVGVNYSGGAAATDVVEEGVSVVVDEQIWRPKMTVKTDPELLKLLRTGEGTEEGDKAREFFLALATCNTIVPILSETEDPTVRLIDYQGESPDEQALLYAAAAYGFMLIERTSGHIVVDVFGQKQRFDILGLHEFDSDRKRMSVIVGFPDKTVKVFIKGADSSMFGVVDKMLNVDIVQSTKSHLHTFSTLGLRTLVIGVREMSNVEFEEWHSSYEKANTALFGRGSLLKAVAMNIENNISILGASGIEDKLQQGVPEAIESLRKAGIKVWLLTGDKQETAISIGFSSNLLTGEMTQIIINSHSKESCKKSLADALAITKLVAGNSPAAENSIAGADAVKSPLALIIDGTSLVYILETELEEELFEVATSCSVVLCCRVAPLQKAGIVVLIKSRTDDMTLAIGDGANDVSMIQKANVGIGISGREGRQAVMASDFAIGQFRFLVPLLLVHGHWNYQRMAYMILYNFYRNSIMVFVLFWYVLYTAFSLTTAISEWSSVLYSVIYTALPTIVVGILDKDLNRKTLLKYPQLYGSGQREERYNLKLFILTIMDSVWQSLAIFFIPYLAYRHSTVDGSSIGDLWTLAVVIMVNLHLGMDIFRWNWIVHASIWGCIVATVICVIIIDALPILPGFWAIFHVMGTWVFWFCLLAILIAGMIPRFATKAFTEFFIPSDIQIARELEKFGNINEPLVSEVATRTLSIHQQQNRP